MAGSKGGTFYGVDSSGETIFSIATSDDIKQLTGKYFEGVNITKLLNHADDMKSAKKLWDISSKLCGLNTDLLID